MASYLQIEKAGKVATVRLNRPEKHNAFDEPLIAELTQAFRDLASDAAVRVVVLAANGQSFSAGADLDWMKRMSAMGRAENERDAMALANLMEAIDHCPKPVVGVIQGTAFQRRPGRLLRHCDRDQQRQLFVGSEAGPDPGGHLALCRGGDRAAACRRYFLTAEVHCHGAAWPHPSRGGAGEAGAARTTRQAC